MDLSGLKVDLVDLVGSLKVDLHSFKTMKSTAINLKRCAC